MGTVCRSTTGPNCTQRIFMPLYLDLKVRGISWLTSKYVGLCVKNGSSVSLQQGVYEWMNSCEVMNTQYI